MREGQAADVPGLGLPEGPGPRLVPCPPGRSLALAAALWFLREELGIRRIYMHSRDSGNRLERIPAGRRPPRSLYSGLPRRFCFEEVEALPSFLEGNREARFRQQVRRGGLRLFRLDL